MNIQNKKLVQSTKRIKQIEEQIWTVTRDKPFFYRQVEDFLGLAGGSERYKFRVPRRLHLIYVECSFFRHETAIHAVEYTVS